MRQRQHELRCTPHQCAHRHAQSSWDPHHAVREAGITAGAGGTYVRAVVTAAAMQTACMSPPPLETSVAWRIPSRMHDCIWNSTAAVDAIRTILSNCSGVLPRDRAFASCAHTWLGVDGCWYHRRYTPRPPWKLQRPVSLAAAVARAALASPACEHHACLSKSWTWNAPIASGSTYATRFSFGAP